MSFLLNFTDKANNIKEFSQRLAENNMQTAAIVIECRAAFNGGIKYEQNLCTPHCKYDGNNIYPRIPNKLL